MSALSFSLPVAPAPVTVSRDDAEAMAAVIDAIEAVVRLPAYREAVLAWAPAIAQAKCGALGVFLGYDFHLTPEGPRLIEVNTNAGGIMMLPEPAPAEALLAMFRAEWRHSGAVRPLASVAIVDERPEAQFLYPEFLAFRDLFHLAGLEAWIAAPEELECSGGRLRLHGRPIDLVYNRLTDFTLEEPAQAALRQAFLAGEVVLTPHPRAHALYADKRDLTLLCDADRLRAFGAPAAVAKLLGQAVPTTLEVTAENAPALWRERRQWFFKPARGFGSKGVYRGDKLTLRVWEEIIAGGYVAQRLVPPSRVATPAGELKLDLRHYVYDGRTLARAARLYRGQATNLRTAGGGFASVRVAEPRLAVAVVD